MTRAGSWPDGQTWIFQGTVLEDATAGTHVCSLTVTPGAGNEIQVLYGDIIAGAGAANITNVQIRDDASRIVTRVVAGLSLASGQTVSFPESIAPAATGVFNATTPIIISGAMIFYAQISTATVSLTHTFAVACRVLTSPTSVVLADSLGTPTLTTNTSKVF